MARGLSKHIKSQMEKKDNNDLLKIWTENNREEFSDQTFDIIEEILRSRSIPIPEQKFMKIFYGRFRKKKLRPLRDYGNYRGSGSITFTDKGIHIKGRHVMSIQARWRIGLAMFFGSLIVTCGMFAPGFILIYLIMEYLWLKRKETVVSYINIINYVAKPKKYLVGIDYHAPKWCTPAVFKSARWSEILETLREKIPQRDAELIVRPPLSPKLALWISIQIFMVLYVLFFIIFSLTIWIFDCLFGIPEIKYGIDVIIIVFFIWILPLILSIIIARKKYRKKRVATRIDGSEVINQRRYL
ncbi:hypothetical protein JW979_06780 [bacterium]|nr:hypothetical protein [candidate division CSSED10-310 bacterium]